MCDRKPSASDIEAAQGLHKAAQQYYAKARYDRAIQSWLDAYNFDCLAHRVLINIGNAYEKLGKTELAVQAFETYLERAGDDADPTIADKVQTLREMLAQQHAQPNPEPPTVTEPSPDPNPNPKPPPPSGSDTGTDEGAGPFPWILVGIGAAAVVAGAVVLGVAGSKYFPADRDCPDRSNCPSDIAEQGEEGKRLGVIGGAVAGVGGAFVVAGLIWYFVADSDPDQGARRGPRRGARLAPTLAPMLAPKRAGLSLGGSF